ncbi:MAG: hypothetical protein V4492_04740 [Chlamydiota bacterium]
MGMKNMRLLLFIFFLLGWIYPQMHSHASPLFLERFENASPGDFVVTLQEGNYSLLLIRSLTEGRLLLEEVSIPKRLVDPKRVQWQQWLDKKAPGHTSWTLYEVDQRTGQLLECYSFSKKGWLYINEAEQFLSKLFSLPLEKVPNQERKRIGSTPSDGELDHRPLWNPPITIAGKKLGRPELEVFKTRWPKDDSLLSLCAIELYFHKHPFPYWLEIKSPHYSFKMRTIDSGHGLKSPIAGAMPHRSPQILGNSIKSKREWKLPIQTPPYYQKLKLYARDTTEHTLSAIALQAILSTSEDNVQHLIIPSAELRAKLLPSHRYHWIIVPSETPDIAIESEELFQID